MLRRHLKWPALPTGLLGPAVELMGAVLIVAGVGLWSLPLALVVAGAACIFMAQGMGARE